MHSLNFDTLADQGGVASTEASLEEAAARGRRTLGTRLVQSLHFMQLGQLPSGEILSYRRDRVGNYQYCHSPFVTTFVHEALGCFDPSSIYWQDGSLHLIPRENRAEFRRRLIDVRRQIRSFLAWQQESPGWWRFFGRGSGIDPDVNTTVRAALALRDRYGGRRLRNCREQMRAVQSFRAALGCYYTFYRQGHGGYGWMDAVGRPVVGFDRVVNAEVLRYLCCVGLAQEKETQALCDYLLQQVVQANLREGTSLYPNPLCFFYALSQAWSEVGQPDLTDLAQVVVPQLLQHQREDGDFGGPLSTALGATALIQLGYSGPALDKARLAVLRGWQLGVGWAYEDFVIDGFGSPALTTALSMAFLARHNRLLGEDAR